MTVNVYKQSSLSWDLYPTDLKLMTFPGGEPHVKGQISGTHLVIDARVSSFNDIGQILVVNDFLRRSGASTVSLFIPYFPGARQDRGAPLTVKVYADLINQAVFDKVVILDPHSDVAPALLNNVSVIGIEEVFPGPSVWPLDKWVLVCPDAGAVKRTERVASFFGYQMVYARKHRDFATGKLSGFECDPIPEGFNAVVVDDICDGGGTFNGLAEAIDTHGIGLDLWVTHGIFSQGLTELLKSYGRIHTTDSFPSIEFTGTYWDRLGVKKLHDMIGKVTYAR